MNIIKKHNVSYKDIFGWLFIGIGLVMLGNSIRLCFSRDIWYDELFTIGMIEHSYGELVGFTARDVHPPLYYCITKFVADLCKLIYAQADGIMIAKGVSVMPYFLLLIYALTFLRKRFGMLVSGVFFFCIIGMPQMSAYMVEVRMYSWALFFVTAAFLHAYEIVLAYHEEIPNVQAHWIALVLYGLAAAYTQYFACVAIVMVYLYVLAYFAICYIAKKKNQAKRNLRNWCVCVAACMIGYIPWLFALVSQITTVRENYWILPLTWRNLGGCVKFLMKPSFSSEGLNVILAVLLFLLYVGVFGAFALRIRKKWKQSETEGKVPKQQRNEKCDETETVRKFWCAVAGCMVLCGLVAFGFIASIVVRPIFVYRYMIPALGCFWLGFAICLDALTNTAWQMPVQKEEQQINIGKLGKMVQICIVLFIAVVGIRNYRAFMGEEEYKIVLMEDTEKALEEISEQDIVIYNFDQLQAVVGYYVNCENYLWCDTPETLIVDMFGEKGSIETTEPMKQWLDEGRTVWFLGSFNSREEICEQWATEGIITEENGSYMLERYWFNIYQVSK